ncbi:MAG TPA: response regulator [Polyangiaceae bacterium]|nr:response regulator [Polyangiaceae bacterium]
MRSLRASAGRLPIILVVEDEPLICSLLERTLEERGYKVHAAISADEALEVAAGCGAIDLLITDIVLSRGSGQEVARRLRANGQVYRTLFMSGFRREELVLDESAGFLPKPFSLRQLLDVVEGMLAGPPNDP